MTEHIEFPVQLYSHNILFGNPVNLIGFTCYFMALITIRIISNHVKCTNEFTDRRGINRTSPRIILLAIKIYCRILFCDGLILPRPLYGGFAFRNIYILVVSFYAPNGNRRNIIPSKRKHSGQNDETRGSHAPFCPDRLSAFLFVVDRFINILVVKLAHSFRKFLRSHTNTSLSAK